MTPLVARFMALGSGERALSLRITVARAWASRVSGEYAESVASPATQRNVVRGPAGIVTARSAGAIPADAARRGAVDIADHAGPGVVPRRSAVARWAMAGQVSARRDQVYRQDGGRVAVDRPRRDRVVGRSVNIPRAFRPPVDRNARPGSP